MPLYHYTIIPLYHYTIIPLYRYTVMPLYRYAIIPLCHYAIMPLCHYAIMPLYHYAVMPLYRYAIMPLCYFAVLLFSMYTCRMATIYAIASHKGGVGKTTTAINLAHGLSRCGKKVLVVDTDTQGHIGRTLGFTDQPTLYQFVTGNLNPKDVLVKAREGLYLLLGGQDTARLKRQFSQADFSVEYQLRDALAPLFPSFEYVLLDCSPGWDVLAVNALFCAEFVIVPTVLDVLAVSGLFDYVSQIQRIEKQGHGKVAQLHTVLPTMLDKRFARTNELMGQLNDYFKEGMIGTPIRANSRLAEAPGHHQTIYEYESPAGKGVADYDALVERILKNG